MADSKNKDIIETALHRMTMAIAAYSDSREDELDDLRFYAASPDNQYQWPADVLATRGSVQGQTINARPCLTINKLPQHVRQVTNDQRQNRPSGKVIPADDKADIEVAEIFNGMVRHIEYMSDADVAYDTACENQVAYGEGYIRLFTQYERPNSCHQNLKCGRIRISFSGYKDLTTQEPWRSDRKWCFVTEDVMLEDFERMFPDAQPVSSLQAQSVGNESYAPWLSVDTIRIADYYYVEHEKATLNLYYGNVSAIKGSPEDQQMVQMGMKPIKSRIVDIKKVKYCKINGFEVLESNDWAGDWIPVVRVVGNEFEIDGRIHVSGLVRNAKDAQRMYNYWVSQEAEMLALAPKAPFIGYGGQFEGYEQQWKTANTTNWPYLEVNPDVTDGAGGTLPLPQRAQPPMASSGLLQAKAGASDDIKSTTGQYDSSLGATSNERSGKAIMARERQTDTGTYHYVDNLARAVRHITRQIINLVPKIYDTQRVARIMGEDGQPDSAKIDPMQTEPVKKIVDQNGIEIEKIYNPGVGTYDVMVTTGPSYMTKRQEALESMGQLLQGNPQLWAVAGDLFIKNMDWPGAQEMAKRFAKTIDPKLMDDGDKDPALQAAEQQMQAMAKEMEQMHGMLQNVSKSMEAQDIKRKNYEAQIKAFDAETKRISAVQAGMTFEQIQDIVMGTVAAALYTGDLISGSPQREQFEMPMEQPPPNQGMMPPEQMQPPMDQMQPPPMEQPQ